MCLSSVGRLSDESPITRLAVCYLRDCVPELRCSCFLPILNAKRQKVAELEREAVEKGVDVPREEADEPMPALTYQSEADIDG